MNTILKNIVYATIVLLPFTATASKAALRDTYAEYIRRNIPVADKQAAGEWIIKFESELSKTDPSDKIYYRAKNIVCDLYETAGDLATSNTQRELLFNNTNVPASTRIDAGLKLIESNERIHANPQDLLLLSQKIQNLSRAEQLNADLNYSPKLAIMRCKTIRWKCSAGQQAALVLRQQGQDALANDMLTDTYSEALQLCENYANDWKLLPDACQRYLSALNYAPDTAYYIQGEITSTLGNHYDSMAKPILATMTRNKGQASLEVILNQYPQSRYSQSAAISIFKLMKSEKASDIQFVAYAKKIIPLLRPGHSVLNFISDTAMNLSRKHHGELLANELFNLVLQQEKSWFPQEYTSHINYQISLIESTMNCIQLGSLEIAGDNIRALKQIANLDPVLKTRLQYVEKAFQRKFDRDASIVLANMNWQEPSVANVKTGDSAVAIKAAGQLPQATHAPLTRADARTPGMGIILGSVTLAGLCIGAWIIMRHLHQSK